MGIWPGGAPEAATFLFKGFTFYMSKPPLGIGVKRNDLRPWRALAPTRLSWRDPSCGNRWLPGATPPAAPPRPTTTTALLTWARRRLQLRPPVWAQTSPKRLPDVPKTSPRRLPDVSQTSSKLRLNVIRISNFFPADDTSSISSLDSKDFLSHSSIQKTNQTKTREPQSSPQSITIYTILYSTSYSSNRERA